ncbi:MAG: hypothetical protein WBW03_10980, partial [Silvibacterium sp.]
MGLGVRSYVDQFTPEWHDGLLDSLGARSLVVYANSITRSEHDDDSGEDIEREIPFLKGYTVFNVEQIDG